MKNVIAIVVIAVATQAIEQKYNDYRRSGNQSHACGVCPSSCKRSRYRSYDGSCNNLLNPHWGTANSAYERLARNSYFDGVYEFPRCSAYEPLMNPREISLKVSPFVIAKDPVWNVITLQWGQILAHDMSLTKGVPQTGINPIKCCTNGKPIPPASAYPNIRCAPIPIPCSDPINAPEGNTCIDFVRTSSSRDSKCSVPGRAVEPLSSVTSFHDLSILYGNSEEEAMKVRAFKKGYLAYVVRNGQQWFPQHPNVTFACSNVKNAQEACYFTGDVRVNQNPQLALVQTVLLREHNRIANKLCSIVNPHWDDERCFQETRRILIAMMQHITYSEFLPIILGIKNMVAKGISYPKTYGYVNDYDPTVNPQILNEHATAAYRGFHTLVVGKLKLYSESRKFIDQIRLSDWFIRPSIIEQNTCGLTRGLTTQAQSAVDRFYDDEITEYLFRDENATIGMDLNAIDIQRSRDHGVATYVEMLDVCGLGRPTCFRGLEKYIKREYVALLKRIYKKVEDVELTVAGHLEKTVSGTLAGPTFLCIMLEQFRRTRVGDQYFYENGKTVGAFTIWQLNSIRRASMSRLLCDNVKGIELMQPMAFSKISAKNSLVPCFSLPKVDLWLWKEGL